MSIWWLSHLLLQAALKHKNLWIPSHQRLLQNSQTRSSQHFDPLLPHWLTVELRQAQQWDVLGKHGSEGHTHSWTRTAEVCLSNSSKWELTLDQTGSSWTFSAQFAGQQNTNTSSLLLYEKKTHTVKEHALHATQQLFSQHALGTAGHTTRALVVIWHSGHVCVWSRGLCIHIYMCVCVCTLMLKKNFYRQ